MWNKVENKNKLPHLSPKSNIKIVERGQNDTSNTQIHEKQHKITNQICFYFLLVVRFSFIFHSIISQALLQIWRSE
jgi:hypothetical protein